MKFAVFLLLARCAFGQLPWEKNSDRVGLALYRDNCVVCHDIDKPQSESKKLGPSFHQLYQKEKMPTANQAPNRAYIGVRIRFGGQLMPAFAKKMTAGEMETLLDWIEGYTKATPATAGAAVRP